MIPKTYKEKNRLLLVGVILFAIVSYLLAIDPTTHLYWENGQFQAKLDSAQTAPENIARLTKQLSGYEKMLSQFGADKDHWEERLLQNVANVCQQHQVQLIQLPPATQEDSKGYKIGSSTIKVEGDYKNLLRVLHSLENKAGIGRIAAVRFILEEDRRTRNTSLFAYIFMQNIEKNKNYEN